MIDNPRRFGLRLANISSVAMRSSLLLATYAVVTAGILAFLLQQLREDALDSGNSVLGAFAQLTEEQTTRTLQNVSQTLQIAAVSVDKAGPPVPAAQDSIRSEFAELLKGSPYLRAISVTDAAGRVVYTSAPGSIGVDLSGRAYFARHRDDPALGFQVGVPVRSRSTEEWLLPASTSIRQPDGTFGGVIVASIDPMFFDRIWTIDKAAKDIATALWNDDGVLLMRSPFDERAMGMPVADGRILERIRAQSREGQFRAVSPLDGQDRMVAYRQLAFYPGITLTVAQSTSRVLAAWQRIVWIVAIGWAVSVAILGALSLWLASEWAARRAAQKRYRLLFDANPFPMAVLERGTRRFLEVNDAAIAQYGWSRQEALAMTADALFLAEDVPSLPAVRERHAGSEGLRTINGLRHRKKDGRIIDVQIVSRPIDFGGVEALLMMALDVTDRLRADRTREAAEAELRDSQTRYRTLFESAPYAAIVTERETLRVVAVNDAATQLYGRTAAEMRSLTIDDFYAPEDRPAAAARRQGFTEETTQLLREIRHLKKDGTPIDVEMAVRYINYDGRPCALAIISDVSERLQTERARAATEEQLRQSQKLELVGQLTGGVAHDFNNILMVIMANVDAVRDEDFDPAEVVKRIDQISGAVERASQLTRQLLAFSRQQTLRLQRANLNKLVNATGVLLHRTLGEHIEIVSMLDDDLWPTMTDPAQVEAALINLCINARDAMPEGGRLLIETNNRTCDAAYVARHPEAATGDYVTMSVTDNGCGIPPDALGKVFEPFFTTKAAGKGTGLGLSMVYGFARQSHGHVTISSEVGRGTSVTLYIPRALPAAIETSGEAATPGPARGSERILVVEDEEEVRSLVVRQLKGLGYDVAAAANGAEGLNALRSGQPCDLLLTDVVMPGPLNGKALAAEAVHLHPGLRVLFMSGYSADAMAPQGIDMEVALLNKPFRSIDLAMAVRRALDGDRGALR